MPRIRCYFISYFGLIMSDLVTITTFNNTFEANLAASHLEREGIETFMSDQNISALYPNVGGPINLIVASPSGAFGGVKLQIKDDDIPKAIEILKEHGYLNEETEKPSKAADAIDKMTNKIPFLRPYPLQVKLLAIIFTILAISIVVFVIKKG